MFFSPSKLQRCSCFNGTLLSFFIQFRRQHTHLFYSSILLFLGRVYHFTVLIHFDLIHLPSADERSLSPCSVQPLWFLRLVRTGPELSPDCPARIPFSLLLNKPTLPKGLVATTLFVQRNGPNCMQEKVVFSKNMYPHHASLGKPQ